MRNGTKIHEAKVYDSEVLERLGVSTGGQWEVHRQQDIQPVCRVQEKYKHLWDYVFIKVHGYYSFRLSCGSCEFSSLKKTHVIGKIISNGSNVTIRFYHGQ